MCGRRTFLLLALLAGIAMGGKTEDALAVWDANGDGVLTRNEVPDAALFAKVDKDGDGKITKKELAAYFGESLAPPKKPASPPAKPPEPKKPAAKKPPPKKPPPDPRTLKERVKAFLDRFDADKDGRIAKKEYPGAAKAFSAYDRNRDGVLERDEVERLVKDRLDAAKKHPTPYDFLQLFDLDRDGKVTRREYDGPAEIFRSYDADRDGVVTEEEVKRMAREMAARVAAPKDSPTPIPEKGLLARYDKNHDSRITLDELGGAENLMLRLDKNGDGVLSGPEVR